MLNDFTDPSSALTESVSSIRASCASDSKGDWYPARDDSPSLLMPGIALSDVPAATGKPWNCRTVAKAEPEVGLCPDENSKAAASLLEHLEGVLISAVIPKVDRDHIVTVSQAEGLQHVGQGPALAPVHLHHMKQNIQCFVCSVGCPSRPPPPRRKSQGGRHMPEASWTLEVGNETCGGESLGEMTKEKGGETEPALA
ncbi:MAG: hypothetical protein FRX49_13595 [Trebouxia sp. A1-2]|nr:MAG: hypothetical protein FRX49_13595 [Trebouxia sp. A1-2]